MDSGRSAKRRKLDPPKHEVQKSPPAEVNEVNTITYSKRRPTGSKETAPRALANGDTGKTSSHDAWREAKAKTNALRGKRPGHNIQQEKALDVYDDIEGAHTHQSPLNKKATPASTPKMKHLDPLRNQRPANSATSSPSKGGANLGFFKQFHQPKSKTEKVTSEADTLKDRLVYGSDRRGGRRDEDEVVTSAERGECRPEECGGDKAPETPVQSGNNRSGKGWAYEKPKKTFEDEVRELESAARQEADKEDDPDAAVDTARKRRQRVSSSTLVRGDLKQAEKSGSGSVVRKRDRTSEKRQTSRTNHIKNAEDREVQQQDAMEIDEAGIERPPVVNGIQARLEAARKDTPAKATQQKPAKTPTAFKKEIRFDVEHLRLLQTILLEKLTAKRPISLTGLDEEYTKVSNLIAHTVTAGESNSMLVIGARGSGKTALVNHILHEQAVQHPNDFHVVRLNGFIHTDDKIALREIWRQLGREMELDDEESTSKNHADTLATLLALLSHPAELGRDQPDLLTKSVIFILHEFDLFAGHPRQTLLYNLFDIAQSRKAPIAVLGLTTRIDVAESLEKRVKSRFSHRYVHLSLAKSFASFQEACKAAISVLPDELALEEREQSKKAPKNLPTMAVDWSAFVEKLLAHETHMNHLRRIYYTTKSVSEFHASMLMPISTLPVDTTMTSDDLLEHMVNSIGAASRNATDSKLSLLSSLSTLQLAILICAARLTAIHNSDTVPFAQAYEEYKVLASRAKLQASASGALAQGAGSTIWGKDVAKGAWEQLIEFDLVMEDGSRGGRVDVGLEEIGMSGVELGSWGRWCREI